MKIKLIILSLGLYLMGIVKEGTLPFSNSGDKIDTTGLLYPLLVKKVYTLRSGRLLWFRSDTDDAQLRSILFAKIDSSHYLGLRKSRYHFNYLFQYRNFVFAKADSILAAKADRFFTDAAIAYCKDLYQGSDANSQMLYDGISTRYSKEDNDLVIFGFTHLDSSADFLHLLKLLEPTDSIYLAIKKELMLKYDSLNNFKKRQLSLALNLNRWIHHFHFSKWVVVNIPEATLRYFENDSMLLKMKVVVGKSSTRTPRLAGYCNEVILYPFWNVPKSIAIKELLPKIKKDPSYIDEFNLEVIDPDGNVLDYHSIDWNQYSQNNFPFILRQSTGCDNSLGVIKFNLESPFSVYLHDTNFKEAFGRNNRFLSHGCIRLEKPLELANWILPDRIDSGYLKSCLHNQVPVPITISQPIPVFVIYQTAVVNSNKRIIYLNDVYHLLKMQMN